MLLHSIWKGITVESVMVGYAVAAAALVYAMIAVDGWGQVFTLLYLPAFVCISIVFEREGRINFVQHMQLLEANEKELEGLVSPARLPCMLIFLCFCFLPHTRNPTPDFPCQDTKRAMVRHITHEIRTPLNTMTGCLGCLHQELHKLQKAGVVIPAAIFDLVTQCAESCNEARDITSNLLSFEKIAAGLEKLELEVVPFLEYVLKAAQPFIFQARAKDVVMTVDAAGVDPSTCVKIDPAKMAQVLRNFFSNAVKFTPERRTISVVVRGERDAAGEALVAVKVLVTDSGPGLTPEELGQLFQEGVQFNANKNQGGCVQNTCWRLYGCFICRSFVLRVCNTALCRRFCDCRGGSGFGLFIAKGVVNLHEGATCGATSPGRGRGSTFFVSIPVTTEAPPVIGSVAVSGNVDAPADATSAPSLTILCVVSVYLSLILPLVPLLNAGFSPSCLIVRTPRW
jgi:signal transduction histidine kinase